MKLTKHIANIITSCRILCSMGILCFPAFSPEFYTMYFLCGFSDMIDGTIARKTNAVSEFGSKLDTVADLVFVVVCLIKLLPMIHIPIWLWIWISAIAVIKIANIVWGFVRKKRLVSVHTVLNKITGVALFLLPLTLTFIKPTYTIFAVCCLATVAAIQEGYGVVKERDVVNKNQVIQPGKSLSISPDVYSLYLHRKVLTPVIGDSLVLPSLLCPNGIFLFSLGCLQFLK